MICDAEDCRASLDDLIKDESELELLQITHSDWKQLKQIKLMLEPFAQYTAYVSRQQPSIQMSARMYLQLEQTLKKISKRDGQFAGFDDNIVKAVKVGLLKFEEYNGYMQGNDIYYIAAVLDPRVKTRWLKSNVKNAAQIIARIKRFLNATYPPELQLPRRSPLSQHKSLEYLFLQEFETNTTAADDSDIDRYLDSPPIQFKLNINDDQSQWVMNWWDANKFEFPSMAVAARDYLPIPASEVDVERLFNTGRDILGIWRFGMSGETLKTLIMLKDGIRRKEADSK